MPDSSPRPLPWSVRITAAVLAAELLALFVFGVRPSFWLISLLVATAASLVYLLWDHRYGPSAIQADLTARWLGLPGAHPAPGGVHVHDGMQPLTIWLGTQTSTQSAVVLTPVADSEMACRIWPDGQTPPPFAGSLTRFRTAPALDRAYTIEQKFAGLLQIEVNDEPGMSTLLTAPRVGPILAVRQEAPQMFKGVTWDGEQLGVHWWGPIVKDPVRMLQLSRAIWSSWT